MGDRCHASTERCAHVHQFPQVICHQTAKRHLRSGFALQDSVPTWRTDTWVRFRSFAQDQGTVMLCLCTLVNVASVI